MRFTDLLILSTRMFKARTSRTLLTILGMSIGIGAILFLVSLGYGLQKTILEKITTSDSLLTLDISEDKTKDAVLDAAALESIKGISGVDEVSPSYQLSGSGKIDNLTTDLAVTVTNPTFLRLSGTKMNEGVSLSDENPRGIIISSMLARIFNKNETDLIGKSIAIRTADQSAGDSQGGTAKSGSDLGEEEDFVIIGTVEADNNSVYMNAAGLSGAAAEVGKYDQVKAKCRNSKDMAAVREQIIGEGFSVSSISETVDQANKVFNVVKIVLMLFGIIALIVSAIGMFNTMTIALLERTEEIGIMKSIGASDFMVSMIFVMESTTMGFLGGVAGILIGWLEGTAFNGIVNLIAHYFGGEKVDLFYSPLWFIMAILAFSGFVGMLTGIIPARRASHIDPLEALRYK